MSEVRGDDKLKRKKPTISMQEYIDAILLLLSFLLTILAIVTGYLFFKALLILQKIFPEVRWMVQVLLGEKYEADKGESIVDTSSVVEKDWNDEMEGRK